MITSVLNRLKQLLKSIFHKEYDFDKSNPLGGGGERVDFIYSNNLNINKLDVYQLNHYRRYEFACNLIKNNDSCGDFACGTGYGSAMLGGKATNVVGVDINQIVIDAAKNRYKHLANVEYWCEDLLKLQYDRQFEIITSFETIEHFDETDIIRLLKSFSRSLKKNGQILFSTPYMQIDDHSARELGFHKTFFIREDKIENWLKSSGFVSCQFYYQNYDTHNISSNLENKDFIICIAKNG